MQSALFICSEVVGEDFIRTMMQVIRTMVAFIRTCEKDIRTLGKFEYVLRILCPYRGEKNRRTVYIRTLVQHISPSHADI